VIRAVGAGVALVAVGGYGRREAVFLTSDVDLLFFCLDGRAGGRRR